MATTASNPDKGKAKEPKETKEDGEPGVFVYGVQTEETVVRTTKTSAQCCKFCLDALFVLLAVVAVLVSIADIVMTVTSAIFTKLYDAEQSGRLVGLVILALLAAGAISVLVYAVVAVFRRKAKPLNVGAAILVSVAVAQAVVLSLACKVTLQDELQLAKSLQQSFQLSRENNPRHAGLWATTQYELKCCGVYGPEDYRKPTEFFSPDVPISCCHTYDPNRSELVQEREREVCKSRKTYFYQGCNELVTEGFRAGAHVVVTLTGALIIVEVVIAVMVALLARKLKKRKGLGDQNAAEDGSQKGDKTEP